MAKQYKTWELIKAWQEGERGKFKSNYHDCNPVVLSGSGINFVHETGDEKGDDFSIDESDLTAIWTKVQEPVDFMTAINSGKRIKPVGRHGFRTLIEWLNIMAIFSEPPKTIINGKWLIEEE